MERRLELIAEVTLATWIHLICVVAALVLGAAVLWRRKGTGRHKVMGRLWVALMAVGAVSSFWIAEIRNGFSPIHALSVWTLLSLMLGVVAMRFRARLANPIMVHRRALQSLYAGGLLIAGGFTFLSHRLLGRLTFGEWVPIVNYTIVVTMAGGGVWLLIRTFRAGRERPVSPEH